MEGQATVYFHLAQTVRRGKVMRTTIWISLLYTPCLWGELKELCVLAQSIDLLFLEGERFRGFPGFL
jgi:hypothetical protein